MEGGRGMANVACGRFGAADFGGATRHASSITTDASGVDGVGGYNLRRGRAKRPWTDGVSVVASNCEGRAPQRQL
eukprot:6181208-Pleurochrysis_carterae.AAC.1